jgi:hypothetical protein
MVRFTLPCNTDLTAFAIDFVAGITRTGPIDTTLTIRTGDTGAGDNAFAILRTTELCLTTGLTTVFTTEIVFALSRQTLL